MSANATFDIAAIASQGDFALAGDRPATIARLEALIEGTPGARLVESRPDCLRAEFRSRQIGVIHDAEFSFGPTTGVVQVRLGSQMGRRGFGVNWQRMEVLRAQLAAG